MKRVLALSALLIATTASAEDWPQWLGTQRDGYWRESGTLDAFPKEGPKVLWRKPVGMGYAGPAVAGGKIYVADRKLTDGAKNPGNVFSRDSVNGNERLLCLDETTGKTLWEYEYPCEYRVSYAAGPRCTPTVDGDRIYWLGTMGDLTCLDAASGKVVWKKNFLKDFEAALPVWGFASHPLIDGDLLICLVAGSEDRGVVAFDKKTGAVRWKALSLSGDPGYCPPVIFDVNGRRELIMWHSRACVSLDPATGKKNWQYDWPISSALTAPTPRLVGKDQLFLTSFYNGSLLLQLTADGPKEIWKSKSKGGQAAVMPGNTLDLHSIMTTPYIAGDFIYGVCSYGELRCLELKTGKRVWETHKATSGKSQRWGHAFLIPHGEQTLIFNEQGELILAKLTPKEYTELGRAKILDATNKMAMGRPVVWSHPAFANQTMYARNDAEIVAVSLKK
jgi:outer membrane protein assembly factor BamB